MRRKAPLIITPVFLSLTLSGCQSTIEAVSTGVGAVGANYFCNKKGYKEYRALCLVGGAFVGNLLGKKLAKYLSEEDQVSMAKTTQKSLEQGTTHSWENPENNTKGSTKVLSSSVQSKPQTVKVLKKRVEQVPPLEMIGEIYQATKNGNVRGGPSTDYQTVKQINVNQMVEVIGKVKGKSWYMISEGGVGSGFVFHSLIKKAPEGSFIEDTTEFNDSDVEETQVAAQSVCRKIEQSITLADGTVHSEQMEACQGPNGWQAKV
ncbi:SH3 domain-containing protein [Thalassotalea marina]|uniref:SH3b domain-containing protein n=1 Tax=Thalassotalea marina TaxID=1673741 RepID=A0A919BQT7_9GAMM|nr:SH3 domain-containing protein [Thalassotalea marina]GHG04714.1 hypothetical protein GCM10017161_37890 [Thalassotalea marina]